jgi:nitrate/nitrite-specific signal transduction histidine kinase
MLFSDVAESLNTGNMGLTNRLTTSKRQNWRGVLIAAFLLIILVVFVLFMVYFICRRCINPSVSLNNGERKNYATIFNFRMYF